MKGNGKSRAGDELREYALKLADHLDGVVKLTRDRCDVLARVAEELKQQTIEQYELFAETTEQQIDKTMEAIDMCKDLSIMVKEVGKRPEVLAKPEESVQAVEDALKELGAAKDD